MKNQQLSVIYYFTDMRLNHWNITYYDGANPLVAGEWAGDIPVPTNCYRAMGRPLAQKQICTQSANAYCPWALARWSSATFL